MTTLRDRYERLDRALTRWMAEHGVRLLRIALGIVFVWFGALKLVPGLSPAAELVRDTVPVSGGWVLPFLALWEMLIGILFISGWALRLAILLLALQMVGAMSPIVLLPDRVFTVFPYGLTLEGQYIFKNLVVLAAAIVIGSTVRGGHLEPR